MKKKVSSRSAKSTTPKPKPPVDKVAAEFAEVKTRKIPAKDLVWSFRFTASNDKQLQAAVTVCVEFLTTQLGKRCRAVMETATVDRKKLQDFIIKPPKMTPALLRKLDQGMAECCKRMKVKYYFLGYGEEVYAQDSWQTLSTVLKPPKTIKQAVGDFDCRKLRFDGLYCHDLGGGANYLRFYRNGQCIIVLVSGEAAVSDIARWFSRERYGAIGTYKVQGSSLTAALEVEAKHGDTIFKLKGRLTKQGLKIRSWNSFSNKESQEVYAFHKVKLK
jgi:hypothetical protein